MKGLTVPLVLAAAVVVVTLVVSRSLTTETPARAAERASDETRLAPPPVPAQPPPLAFSIDDRLERDVRALVAGAAACLADRSSGKHRASETAVSVHVRDLATGEVLVALDDEVARRPASCMKLVTTATALVELGPGWEFTTGFDVTGTIADGALAGDLVVRAGGDPLYAGTEPGLVEARLDEVADALVAAGIQRIDGDLVLDLGTFQDPAAAPEWPDPSQHWQEYCALAAGLTVNGSVIQARVTPRGVGERASIRVWPAAHGLTSRYTTTTVSRPVNDVRVGATATTVTVGGEIGRSLGAIDAEFSHPDPIGYFASSLRAALDRARIALRGTTRQERGAPGGRRVYTLRSPLADCLVPINTHSLNSIADQVFLATGAAIVDEGTRAGAQLATERALERLGVSTAGLAQVDGSGLSRANRVSARQLAALLCAVLDARSGIADAYRDSLAVAGETGTLAKRLRDSPARGRAFAKSGWIRGTSSLAGLARSLDGRDLVFAILVEYPAEASGMNTHCFKPMHDAIVERLVVGSDG